jgi:formylglycine-generating enzyme required for sulfatase activity
LTKFGQAFGRLATPPEKLSDDAQEFIARVASGLAHEGQVVSVRLALFAEMVKGKPWVPQTLEQVGGTDGIGVNFLEETFVAKTANPKYRQHQSAAREVLKSLLPEVGTDIKGHMRSYGELLDSSEYKHKPKEFEDLLRILDGELRLITPTDPEGLESDAGRGVDSKYYQLTHDYLVKSLREWLTRKQKETRAGRAELCLAERSALWKSKPENRHLPSLKEWIQIRFRTDKEKWTPVEQKMMRQAKWRHGLRSGLMASMLLLLGFAGLEFRKSAERRKETAEASRLVAGLLKADTSQVQSIIEDLKGYRRFATPELKTAFAAAGEKSSAKLHAGLALLSEDESMPDFLGRRLLDVAPAQFAPVREMLAEHQELLEDDYWDIATNAQEDASRRFQATCALASFDSEHPRWQDPQFARFLASHLVRVGPADLVPWQNALRPVKNRLVAPLMDIYRDDSEGEQVRSFATDTLVSYLADDPDRLFELLTNATETQFPVVYGSLVRHRERAIQLAELEIAKSFSQAATKDEKELLAQRQTNSAVLLYRFGRTDPVWPLLRQTSDPRVRSYLVHWLSPRGGDPKPLLDRYHVEPDLTVKRALLLCLGEFPPAKLPLETRAKLIDQLIKDYRTHPDSGIHSAAEWLLRHWEQEEQLLAVDEILKHTDMQIGSNPFVPQQWYMNRQGQTLVAVAGPIEFEMGSPASEAGREGGPEGQVELRHRKRIGRSFAIANKEVTVEQFLRFRKDHQYRKEFLLSENGPVNDVTWYDAAMYCNWLSDQEGIPETEWCYLPNAAGDFAEGMRVAPDYLSRTGYRLPTEAEWECACRAGAVTSRPYGETDLLLGKYAWFTKESFDSGILQGGTLKPNDWGLFDMLGNTMEWCHDRKMDYREGDDTEDPIEVVNTDSRIIRGGSFSNLAVLVRCAYRGWIHPQVNHLHVSFRPARTLPASSKSSGP